MTNDLIAKAEKLKKPKLNLHTICPPTDAPRHTLDIITWYDQESDRWITQTRLQEYRCGKVYGSALVLTAAAKKGATCEQAERAAYKLAAEQLKSMLPLPPRFWQSNRKTK